MHSYRYQRRLHWSECDPGGIVFAPHYMRWIIDGVNEMLLSLGFDPNQLIDERSRGALPLLQLEMKCYHPPKLHETVTHEIEVEKLGSKSLTFRHRILRDEVLMMEATETRVWGIHALHDAASLKAVQIPEDVRTALSVS